MQGPNLRKRLPVSRPLAGEPAAAASLLGNLNLSAAAPAAALSWCRIKARGCRFGTSYPIDCAAAAVAQMWPKLVMRVGGGDWGAFAARSRSGGRGGPCWRLPAER